MHLSILPWFESGLSIMKYVSNHPTKFDNQWACFFIGFVQCCYAFIFSVFNSIMLYDRDTVYFVLISYMTITILVTAPELYYKALVRDSTNAQFEVFEQDQLPRVKWFNKDHTFGERTCSSKIQRLVFKTFRLVYVSCVYYFCPLLYLFIF